MLVFCAAPLKTLLAETHGKWMMVCWLKQRAV